MSSGYGLSKKGKAALYPYPSDDVVSRYRRKKKLQCCHIRFSSYIPDMGSQAMQKVVHNIVSCITDADELHNAHTGTMNKHGTDSAKAFKNCVNISRLCRASISKRKRLRCIPVRER
jgi:hypothetical protein